MLKYLISSPKILTTSPKYYRENLWDAVRFLKIYSLWSLLVYSYSFLGCPLFPCYFTSFFCFYFWNGTTNFLSHIHSTLIWNNSFSVILWPTTLFRLKLRAKEGGKLIKTGASICLGLVRSHVKTNVRPSFFKTLCTSNHIFAS